MTEEKINRGGPKRILPEIGSPEWDKLCQRYKDGEPLSNLGKEYRVRPGSIRTAMSQHGVTRKVLSPKAHRLLPDVGSPEWETLTRRYRAGEPLGVLASAYHISPRTISNNMALYGITRGGLALLELDQIVDDGMGLTRLESEVLKLVRERAISVGEISRRVNFPHGVSSETIIKTVDALRAKHYEVILDEVRHEVSTPHELRADFVPTDFQYFRRHYTIGLLSDSHLGSEYQQMTALYDAYKILDDRKTDFNLHAGDFVDGRDVYRGHRDEVFLHSSEEQRKYAVDKYPKSNRKTKTWVIGGQHDYSFHKLTGYNLLEHICTERKDLVYKGFFRGEFRVKAVPIELQHPGGGLAYARCFDDKTSIMTTAGWKPFKDIADDEIVATLNLHTDTFEWQKISEKQTYNYTGKLLHFKSRCIDLLVSPEHRMLVRVSPHYIAYNRSRNNRGIMPQKGHPKLNGNWQVMSAAELARTYTRQKWETKKKVANWNGQDMQIVDIPHTPEKRYGHHMIHLGRVPIEPLLRIIGWYITEGSISKKMVTFSQNNEANRAEIAQEVNAIGLHATVTNRSVLASSRELMEYLANQCGKGSKNKRIPPWVKELNKPLLQVLIDTMFKGDGWRNEKGLWYGYKSYSPKLLDDFSEILTKCGHAITMRNNTITIIPMQNEPTITRRPAWVDYNGCIYDVSVSNKFILVKRNGRVSWSGNSYRIQKIIENMVGFLIPIKGSVIPKLVVFGHWHTPVHLPFYMGIDAVSLPCFQAQTPFLKQRGLMPTVGFAIAEVWLDKDGNLSSTKVEFINQNSQIKERDF